MKSGNSGARWDRPKDIGAAMRTRPRRVLDCSAMSASTASPSARMRAARSSAASPAAVSASRREVRCSSVVFIRASSRVTALDTVAWDSASSAAARAKEPHSATLAKMAQASRSGSRFMCMPE
nr:hypothetical protein [Chromobacterium violaceum]